jgi:predicted dehydrogenase
MVHKATHHFDLVNWWLGADPVTVTATGKRDFYTPAMAQRLGLASHHERCLTCPEKDKCTFMMDLAASPNLKRLYLDQEKHDGYFRDRCVFRPEIDIEDTMNVIVGYTNGVTMSYSLNAFNAWEGYQIAFNGTKGRLEHGIVEQLARAFGQDSSHGDAEQDREYTRIIPLRGAPEPQEIWRGVGGHGGGDKVMLDDIFLADPPADKYLRNSDERGGAASILVGIAANECFRTGRPVKVADLVTGWEKPDYAPMPTHQDPVPMPPRPQRRG